MGAMLWLALGAMLAQQTVTTWGKSIVPVVGKPMADALHVAPELVGLYATFVALASTIGATASGGWIQRFGAMRVSQASLLLMAAGLSITTFGWVPAIPVGAFVLGIGTVIATPASSEILARYAPPRHAPLIFSIKQTGVPAGTMLAGLIGTAIAARYDWRAALLTTAATGVALAVALQPLAGRIEAGAERAGTRPSVLSTMIAIVRDREMRGMAFAQAAYVGLQNTFTTFFPVFMMVDLHYDLVTTGWVFAAANVAAVFSRIFWGWIAGRVGGPRRLLALLGVAMSVVAVLMGTMTPSWPLPAVVAVAVALAGTALAWHGVNLSEVARLSRPGMIGAMTGGIIAFGSATSILYPLTMSAVLYLTDSYLLCFWLSATPPLLVAISLFRPRSRN